MAKGMGGLRALWFRLRTLFRRTRLGRELDEELDFHRDMLARDFEAAGLDARDARAAANRRLGSPLAVRERSGESWGFLVLEDLVRDLHIGARFLARSPGFAAVAICTIGLAIGVNTGFFTLVDAFAWQPTPVVHPEGLVRIFMAYGGRGTSILASYPEVRRIKEGSRTLSDVIPYAHGQIAFRGPGAEAVRAIPAGIVAGDYFEAFGGRPAAGRLLRTDDDRPGAPLAIVISDPFWASAFHRSPGVVGAAVTLNGTPATVVGVARRAFIGFVPLVPDIWIPFSAADIIGATPGDLQDPENRFIELKGRLRPGVTMGQATGELSGLVAEPPAPAGSVREASRITGVKLRPNNSLMVLDTSTWPFLAPAFLLAALVLVLACANLANLLLARAFVRRREVSVRLSLGASRSRLVRQLLTESTLVAAVGAALGVLLGDWIVSAVGRHYFAEVPAAYGTVLFALRPSWRVVAYAIFLVALSVLTFGLAPALQATNPDLMASLKGGDGVLPSGVRRSWFRDALVVVQVGASFVLLAASGTLVRTMHDRTAENTGLSTATVTMAQYGLSAAGHAPPDLLRARASFGARVGGIPGVEATSRVLAIPFAGWPLVTIADADTQAAPRAMLSNRVTPGYFQVVGQRIIRGRGFSAEDSASEARVVVLTKAAARTLWPMGEAVGRSVRVGLAAGMPERIYRVIGIAADAHSAEVWDYDESGYAYMPATAADLAGLTMPWLIRTVDKMPRLARNLTDAAHQVNADVPLLSAPLATTFQTELMPYRYAAAVTASVGTFGLFLALLGLYGIVAFAVAQRRRDVAVHLALGATSMDVLRLTVHREMRLVLVGLGVGMLLALGEARLLDALLLRLTPLGIGGLAVVASLLFGVSLVATVVPARRALHVAPMQVLRQE